MFTHGHAYNNVTGLCGLLQRRRWRWALKNRALKRIHSQSVLVVAFVQVIATTVARIEATPVAIACHLVALAANKTAWIEY